MNKHMKKVAKWGLLLFSLMVLFLVGDPAKVNAATKAEYTYKTYDKSKTYKGKKSTIKDIEKYKRVILKGDSDAVKKINAVLKAECDAKLADMPAGYAKNDADMMGYDSQYSNTYTSKVTYNDNGVISIRINFEWYQGGTADYGWDCYTFDLTTGDQLQLTDVCKGSNASLSKKIKNKLVKKYSKDAFFADKLDKITAKDSEFYLNKNGKAVVTFDKYEISYGAAGAFTVTLNSKY